MRRLTVVLAAVSGLLMLDACHPVSADSTAGRPVPPADAPSDGASGPAAADNGGVSDVSAD